MPPNCVGFGCILVMKRQEKVSGGSNPKIDSLPEVTGPRAGGERPLPSPKILAGKRPSL